jgi:hypothetical protein
MVLGLIERGEVVVVALDLGTVCDFEPDRMENRLDALERAGDRVQRADASSPARQRHVERFFLETRFELLVLDRFAPRAQRLFELVLRFVEAHAHRGALLGRKLAERLAKLGDHPGLPEVFRFCAFELVGIVDAAEDLEGFADYGVYVLHRHQYC